MHILCVRCVEMIVIGRDGRAWGAKVYLNILDDEDQLARHQMLKTQTSEFAMQHRCVQEEYRQDADT